jgi:hypothetical protein
MSGARHTGAGCIHFGRSIDGSVPELVMCPVVVVHPRREECEKGDEHKRKPDTDGGFLQSRPFPDLKLRTLW